MPNLIKGAMQRHCCTHNGILLTPATTIQAHRLPYQVCRPRVVRGTPTGAGYQPRHYFTSSRAVRAVYSMASRRSPTVIVADIGGTNCRFQVWQLDDVLRPSRLALEKFLPTKDYPTFMDALGSLLKEEQLVAQKPMSAAFACAGPVSKGRCEMTNLGWTIDAAEVQAVYDIKATVLNDFEAIGYGVPVLSDANLLCLYDAPIDDKGPKGVLGPGTGLGEAQLFWDQGLNNYRVCPSEGAHATFAPRGWKQRALQAHVQNERGHCSVERVGCGDGLRRIYDFLGTDEVSQYPGRDLELKKSPAEISTSALDGSDPRAEEALDIFLSIVGAEAGQMALRGLTTGGVYICGGIFPKVLDRVKLGGVREAFLWRDSRFHDKVLKHIPLFVVLEEKVGLLGTREQAIRLLLQEREEIQFAT